MQRKVFRIEQMVEAGPASQHDDGIESCQPPEIELAITRARRDPICA
ncbi:MAG TPA: hypothetical protein VFN84_03675 [Pseudolabrys sp.]|nr:hypothetical protein [Pseudolabrys sp.]